MKAIDEPRLGEDPQYRYEYLAEFVGFGPAEVGLIQAAAPHIGPHIPQLVERTYQKLLAYDATARHFVPPNAGFEGASPGTLAALSPEHPQIQFRKDHLNRYFAQLIGRSYDAKMVQYLDMVGRIHTADAGNSAIQIPLVQMNALLGVITDALLELLQQIPLPQPQRDQTVRAFNKLMWIQNDFVNRHYTA